MCHFHTLLEQLSSSPGDSIPLVCQDWANTKAAYRFFDNDRISEAEILGGHFQATRERASATSGPILVMHDTTEFTYKREDVCDRRGNMSEAALELKFRRIRVLPPIGKQSRYPMLELTVLHATERGN